MNQARTTSFSEVTLTEAIARRLECWLVLRPYRPGLEKRLRSQFLALAPNAAILDIPTDQGKKFFVPGGCDVGMVFTLGEQVLQARSKVIGQILFATQGGSRFDALELEWPAKVVPLQKRAQPRWTIPGDRLITALLWPADAMARPPLPAAKLGQVANWSQGGLGLRFAKDPSLAPETDMIVCLEEGPARPRRFYRGRTRHTTASGDDGFLVGLADVSELLPGQAVEIIRALAAAP